MKVFPLFHKLAQKSMKKQVILLLAVGLTMMGWWSGAGWAQAKLPRIGILTYAGTTDAAAKQWLEPFWRKLAELGWIEGRQVLFEVRRAGGDSSLVAEAASELVRLKVDVIFADSAPSVRAAHAASTTIPIVGADFTNDPVAEGYVENYGRPGKNITGVFLDAPDFAGKWLELLQGIVPNLSRAVVLWDPSPGSAHLQSVKDIARSLRLQLQVIEVREPVDIDRAFSLLRGRPQALIVLPSPTLFLQGERIAKLALEHRLPATSMSLPFAEEGGALAYGPEGDAAYGACAVLVAKILAGTKPGDLPVERPTKIALVVNLKSAKALGLSVPQSILLRADKVIR